ncbi:murein L,D-transpeptidase [Xenorhabdus sp. Reich]|uniref:Murein L,D-transpeptidase n=1 Tax=Xenorhabdus littoralis TaxID=2582835 RepID=A0ABU4SKN2_9GAMM|nr:murein L,D-transpeptidase family protein [Xenorhabdus sp. Reich]MDX7999197.1 murein L,D-transpeptidase [Xenorhabdus sp. Reich]
MKKMALSLSVSLFLFHVPFSVMARSSISAPAITQNTLSWLKLSSEKPPLEQIGTEVFIQIFKEERILELYTKGNTGRYQLTRSYPICNYSGGLGPKTLAGDFKSPEGFYHVSLKQLKPNSRYYRAINLGFPNEFDKSKGYSGNNLMIHGECKSIGCYAMTNRYMDEIYQYAESAFYHGQHEIKINIYPFRMTPQNMRLHKNNDNNPFWKQLMPAYIYFAKNGMPATVSVIDGQYVVNEKPENPPSFLDAESNYSLTEMK